MYSTRDCGHDCGAAEYCDSGEVGVKLVEEVRH